MADAAVSAGGFGEKQVTLTKVPQRPVVGVHAAAHIASGSPPNPDVRYQIEWSGDAGKTWHSIVKDWSIPRRGDEPKDFWSQSFCYGSVTIERPESITPAGSKTPAGSPLQVRFRNDGGKRILRAEMHLIEQTRKPDPVKVTYGWSDSEGRHEQSHLFSGDGQWDLPTAQQVETHWVEFQCVHSAKR